MMEPRPRQRLNYTKLNGDSPFELWLDALKDTRSRAIIRTRMDRLALGMLDNHHDVGDGVRELVIDYGPGYRVYYAD